jgi:inorganic pyrophosphatase
MVTTKHLWHIFIDSKAKGIVKEIVEIPTSSRMKYELDKATGMLKLGRTLYTAILR